MTSRNGLLLKWSQNWSHGTVIEFKCNGVKFEAVGFSDLGDTVKGKKL